MVLVQTAAYGPKNPSKHEIVNPIEIPIGKGILGSVAQSGKAERIGNTARDNRYIVDDIRRFSEIAVPIFVEGKIFGVIDSEHHKKNFFKKHHLRALEGIATLCSDKISKYIIQERLRTKISRDLHDEIGSSLTSINVLSKVALSKAQQAEVANYLSKIKNATSQTMENMSDIVWAINPINDRLEVMTSRMKEFAADICEGQGIELEFLFPDELKKLTIDLTNRKNIFLIFKETVNNAVKYSGCTLLKIDFSKTDNILKLTIEDNGNGFDAGAANGGNGLKNIQERARESGGSLRIDTNLHRGTTITLEIPLTRFWGNLH